jgi:hypothetical protein
MGPSETDSFELVYSVQIDSGRMLELLVDELDSGDCIWQVVDSSGRLLDCSDRYADQARCLRDGLNNALGEGDEDAV